MYLRGGYYRIVQMYTCLSSEETVRDQRCCSRLFACLRAMTEEEKNKVVQILRSAGVRASLGVY